MRRPAFESQEDIVISERSHAASNEDPDVAPACETAVPDTKQVRKICVSSVLCFILASKTSMTLSYPFPEECAYMEREE